MKSNLWMYSTGVEMRKTARALIIFGAEVFYGAKLINDFDRLKAINEQLQTPNPGVQPIPPPEEIVAFSFEYLVDCVRILIFFENYMKGQLVARGFVVQLINRQFPNFSDVAKDQKIRPVHIDEIQNLHPFEVNQAQNFITHPAMLSNTLGFSILIGTSEYLKYYNFSPRIIETIKELNAYRNQLHFHNEIQFQVSDEYIARIQELKNFAASIVEQIHQNPNYPA